MFVEINSLCIHQPFCFNLLCLKVNDLRFKIGLFSSQIEMNSGFERNDEKNDVYNKLPLKKIKEAL